MNAGLRWSLAAVLFLAACGGGGSGPSSNPPPAPPSADIDLLFMGNSHTSNNGLPKMVEAMVAAARPGKSVAAVEAPGWMFLSERANDAASLDLLRHGTWASVVLQAQEYSTSGLFSYPTDGAEALVRMTTQAHAVPVLFPEWPRRGIDESQRIYDLHVSIARDTPACVAPIPQAFDRAVARYPDIDLYAADGNHSSPAGAFLAALVIANTMTGYSPTQLPAFAQFGIDNATQERLRGIAAETVAATPPRQWCAGAPLLPD